MTYATFIAEITLDIIIEFLSMTIILHMAIGTKLNYIYSDVSPLASILRPVLFMYEANIENSL